MMYYYLLILLAFLGGCLNDRSSSEIDDSGFKEDVHAVIDTDSSLDELDASKELDSDDSGQQGEDSKNECEEDKEIRMEAIRSECADSNLIGCCYCSCELAGPPGGPGCTCEDWHLLANVSTEVCEGGALVNASTCINDAATCANIMKTIVLNRCVN